MGSFEGHLLPGVIFVFYGLTWITLSSWLHLVASSGGNRRGRASSSGGSFVDFKREVRLGRLSYIPQPFCGKVPLEPMFKIFFSALGIIVESFAGEKDGKVVFQVMKLYNRDGSLHAVSKVHHITMYGAFLVSGVVDLIGLIVRIPRNITKVFLVTAFFVEGLLFWFHVHDKDHLNIAVHTYLIIAIFASVVLSFLRIPQPANIVINMLFGVSILLQGTWFIHAGSILYQNSTTWSTNEDSSEKQIMFAVVIFNWHVVGNMFVALLVYMIMLCCFRGSIKYRKRRADGSKWAWPSLALQKDTAPNEEEAKLMAGEDNTKDTLL